MFMNNEHFHEHCIYGFFILITFHMFMNTFMNISSEMFIHRRFHVHEHVYGQTHLNVHRHVHELIHTCLKVQTHLICESFSHSISYHTYYNVILIMSSNVPHYISLQYCQPLFITFPKL